jgi:hypothetical protein
LRGRLLTGGTWSALLASAWLLIAAPSPQDLYRRGSSGGGGAPTDATYITQTANGVLTNEQALSALATGYMKVTTGTGAVTSQAVPIPIADGGTNGITKTAAFNNLADGSTDGDLMVYNGTNWVRFPRCAQGQFIRWNLTVSPTMECTAAANYNDQNADVANSSNTVLTSLFDMIAAPAADTWVSYNCQIHYASADVNTGIFIGLFANNIGSTAAPQYMNARFTIGGFTAAGTLSATANQWAYTTTSGALLNTTATNAANVWK